MFLLRPSWADSESLARIATDPSRVTVSEGTFTLTLTIDSDVSVNTFSGELYYDPAIVAVDAINYHSSIADLWVNEPAFDNTNGLVHFTGGTTQVGGFVGSGTLFTVTFRTLTSGVTTIGLTEAILLQHDGFGTPVDLEIPDETIVTITPRLVIQNNQHLQINPEVNERDVTDFFTDDIFDLNDDKTLSFSDVGVMIQIMNAGDHKVDFNKDGKVTEKDLEILFIYINR